MITNEERREVARKLRFNARTAPYMNTPDDFAREVFRAAMDESTADYRTAIDRLADLIDPGDATEAVDRDALLGLVKELELGAQCAVGRKWISVECERMAKHLADDYGTIARRIREALGVES